jgi:hypothetical protein
LLLAPQSTPTLMVFTTLFVIYEIALRPIIPHPPKELIHQPYTTEKGG